LRKEIIAHILGAGYLEIKVSKSKIDAAIMIDIDTLSQTAITIVTFFTSIIFVIGCMAYLASISLTLFVITLLTSIAGASVYRASESKNLRDFETARLLESKFLDSYNDIIHGFKEIYMDPEKGKFIYKNNVLRAADDAFSNSVRAYLRFSDNQIIGQVLFYILVSCVLLVFSVLLKVDSKDLITFVFTLIYLLGSIEAILILLPGFARAKISADKLMELKLKLEQNFSSESTESIAVSNFHFEGIYLMDLEFDYALSGGTFYMGPINLKISRGQVIFIYGANGSGKTTLVHSIIGLCVPLKGKIFFNNTLITPLNYESYRSYFSVVFSDFYLFDQALNDTQVEREKWNFLVELFELDGKVSLVNNYFSTTHLSTGQRKRLALINALLEDKPIIVLDEWAADQDPYFRKKFYTVILPYLKSQEITIIAITHDDNYFHCADALYRMNYGQLSEDSSFKPELNRL
jgi:putative ATP-binding cassette transporter